MKVTPIALEFTDEHKAYFKSAAKSVYQLNLGKEYTVYAIYFVPDSVTDYTMYLVLDDVNRLIPVPACLFDVSDSRTSMYWHANYDRSRFLLALEPKEFITDPYLSEHVLDRDPQAWEVFSEVRRRMEAEGT